MLLYDTITNEDWKLHVKEIFVNQIFLVNKC